LPGRRAPQAVIRKGAAPVAQSEIAREAGPGFRKCSIRAAGHHSIFKQQSRHCERKRSNPAFGPGCKGYRFESGLRRSGIFFRRGLDKIMGDLPVQQDDDNRPAAPLRRCTAGPGPKIAKTTPCKVKRTRPAAPALRCVRAKKMLRRHGLNPISSRSGRGDAAGPVVPAALLSPYSMD
jgi:hypothetical protein